MSNNHSSAIALPVSTLAIAAANGTTLVLPLAGTTVATTQTLAELAHREYQVCLFHRENRVGFVATENITCSPSLTHRPHPHPLPPTERGLRFGRVALLPAMAGGSYEHRGSAAPQLHSLPKRKIQQIRSLLQARHQNQPDARRSLFEPGSVLDVRKRHRRTDRKKTFSVFKPGSVLDDIKKTFSTVC